MRETDPNITGTQRTLAEWMNKMITQGLPWLRLCASTARGTGLIPGDGITLNNKPDNCLNGGSLFAICSCLSMASLSTTQLDVALLGSGRRVPAPTARVPSSASHLQPL